MSLLQLENLPVLASAYAVIIYVAMLAISSLFSKLPVVAKNITINRSRYGSLDGLRGLLSVGVFIHHSFTAYKYFVTGIWTWSSSPIFNQLGQTTVALFFMMTGFLFTIKSMSAGIDWKSFYVARIARLFPLYGIVTSVLFVVVFLLSNQIFHESVWTIIKEFVQWISFAYFGRPDINKFPMTWTLIAGVNWSLRYEIIFYVFAVPALHLFSKFVCTQKLLFFATILLSVLLEIHLYNGISSGDLLFGTQFLCGITVAYAYKEPSVLRVMQSNYIRIIAGVAVLRLAFLNTAYNTPSILITLILFTAIIGGFSMGGLLKTPAAMWLGDISYGIYLIHGMILWLIMFAIKYFGNLPKISILEYIMLMIVVGTVAISLASLSYIFVEKPAMTAIRKWSENRQSAPESNG